jgi:hypothetical protein
VADFPKLEPFSRVTGLGVYAGGEVAGIAGTRTTFLHASPRLQQPLTLIYRWIELAELELIRQHFDDHYGGHVPFRLPGIIWAGQTTVFNTQAWKYDGPPEEEEQRAGRYHVTVKLVSVTDTVARTTTDP